ncbi:MAG: AAA family ATPase [Nitrospiraceae bacterium]|nr:AAA family ATPase [Nitrospiraceae bacterium]
MIYDNFFKFREEPFGVTPDPKFLYMSKKHEDALAHLQFGMSESRGFIMLTGEVGSGKTTLIRYLLDNLGQSTHTSMIINPMVEPLELLKLINHDFGVVCMGDTQKDHLEALNNFLLNVFSKDEKAVLVIDEAQELSMECLEFIRLLSNLETNTKKLLQVILVGQPELKGIVSSERLRQLDQRIAVRYHLEPLGLEDTVRYVNHRLKIAGGMALFPEKCIRLIHKYSHGIPRLINLVCDRSLLLAYSSGFINLSARTVKGAVSDLSSDKKEGIKRPSSVTKPVLVSIGVILLTVIAYTNLSVEENYLDAIKNALSGFKTTGKFYLSDNIYMVTDEGLSEDACALNLMSIYGERNLEAASNVLVDVQNRGYSVYRLSNELDRAIKLNVPGIIHLKNDSHNKCAVIKAIVGDSAVLIGSMEGRKTVKLEKLKDNIAGISIYFKNKFTGSNKISLLQQELKKRGFFKFYVTGIFGEITKKALRNFQKSEGLQATGRLDIETVLLLSKEKNTPRLIL